MINKFNYSSTKGAYWGVYIKYCIVIIYVAQHYDFQFQFVVYYFSAVIDKFAGN